MGLRVKLDTNGLRPDVLESLLGAEKTRPDYIAMDLKTSPERYISLLPGSNAPASNNASNVNTANPGENLKRSAALLRSSGIAHEFRSIALPSGPDAVDGGYFSEQDRAALAALAGNSPWHIRPFVPGNCLDPTWDNNHGYCEK
jgi:pyruvate formate lyase activating enzyme